jgi:branched-chain amino acid transport system ATP-binding protein
MLHLQNVESGYGEGQVLFNISLSISGGSVVSLMGRNGMGKTTTIRTIMGQLPLTGGKISLFGDDQSDKLPFQIARAGIGLVPEGRQIFSNLTVAENLKTFYLPPREDSQSQWHYERVMDLFPQLVDRCDHAGSQLSGGEQQMLAIGRALMTNPKLLILDEATEGLAPIIRTQIWNCLAKLKSEGQSILVIDKNVKAIARLADHHYILDKGRIVWDGNSISMLKTPGLTARYLGI